MKLTCALARDLLALYQEALLSGESRTAVEEHLSGCGECRRALEGMRAPDAPGPAPGAPLRLVGRKLRRDRRLRLAAITAALLFLGTALFYHVSGREYLRHKPGLVTVEKTAPGRIEVRASGVAGIQTQVDVPSREDVDARRSEGTTIFLSLFRTAHTTRDSVTAFTLPYEEIGELKVYYASPDENAVLLYGREPVGVDGLMLLPRLALNFYRVAAAGAAAVLLLLLLLLRRRERARRLLTKLLCLPLCYLLSHLAIKGTGGASWDMMRDFSFIMACFISLCAAALLWLGRNRVRL